MRSTIIILIIIFSIKFNVQAQTADSIPQINYDSVTYDNYLKANWDGLIMNTKEAIKNGFETITIRKRNWHLIGSDEQTLAFKRVRSISIDEHFIGADIHIKVVGGTASVFCLSKGDARKIKEILLEFNANGTGTTINVV